METDDTAILDGGAVMARKSRRASQISLSKPYGLNIKIDEHTNQIPTALYVRLSSEQDDNDTIQNQLEYLKEYVSGQEDLFIYDVYSDNGYTGTNFERPAFMRMMDDAQSGRVQCIVVKDLSRFGRNFVETGYYIESLLPKMNIRIIAINDGYDSSSSSAENDITIPLRNMVNDMYAKDISRKICASNEARRDSGRYTIEKCIYGYLIDKENNQFVINPETAPVVILVFHWYLSGIKPSEIARRLNLLGIDTPNEYKYEYEFQNPLEKKHYWDSGKVLTILSQEAYAGDRFLGMRRNRLYINQQKQEWLPREKWTVYEDDHPAIVSHEDMQQALQMIRKQKESRRKGVERTEKHSKDREGLFSTLVYCRKCGICMHHMNLKYPDGRVKSEGSMYECNGKLEVKSRRGCRRRIKEGYLQTIVAKQIRLLIQAVVDQEEMSRNIRSLSDNRNPVYRIQTAINNLNQSISEVDKKVIGLYTDLSDGLIDQDDYKVMKRKYHYERSLLSTKLNNCKQELVQKEKAYKDLCELSGKLGKYLDDFRLTKELVQMLIERIDVDQNNNIDILFKFNDVFESIFDERLGDIG
ncbi:MAG: recombinase family protein [Firmicutes bacterium]|nr:recombinase family protein [Bacillota bacterium]